MTDKELRKLSRNALLEMLLAQSRENDRLRAQVEQLQRQLSERQLKIDQAGSIAEASLQINHVFEAAQTAAEQYLENIQTLSGRQEEVCQQMKEESTRQAKMLLAETRRKCQAMEAETTEKCAKMTKEAEDAADRAWRDAQARIQKLIDDQAGLRELLAAFPKESK